MRVSSGGVTLRVQADGPPDGPVVVFLHGVGGSRHIYGWLPADVLDGRRVLRVDLRGHGDSDRPGAYRIGDYTADLAAILREAGPAVVVGHSLGGCIAWTAAQRHPGLVRAAFLEDPPLYYSDPAEWAHAPARRAFPVMRDRAIRWQAEGLDARTMSEHIGAARFGSDPSRRMRDVLADDALAAMGRAHAALDPAVIQGAADNTTLEDIDLSAPVDAPVLVLAADEAVGGVFAARHAERMAASHPQVEVVAVAGVGHHIAAARAFRETYLAQLTRFLDEHAPARGG